MDLGVDLSLNSEHIRASLVHLWGDLCVAEVEADRIVFAMPHADVEGWQVVVEVTTPFPAAARLGDGGRTLGRLRSCGVNFEGESIQRDLRELIDGAEAKLEGDELVKMTTLPPRAEDIHVFAELLGSVSHLSLLGQAVPRPVNRAEAFLGRVLADRGIEAKQGAILKGKVESAIRVDFLVERAAPVAMKVLGGRQQFRSNLERWGYRWYDLKREIPDLRPVMVYDPANVTPSVEDQAVGDDICEVFCAYDEVDQLESVLQ